MPVPWSVWVLNIYVNSTPGFLDAVHQQVKKRSIAKIPSSASSLLLHPALHLLQHPSRKTPLPGHLCRRPSASASLRPRSSDGRASAGSCAPGVLLTGRAELCEINNNNHNDNDNNDDDNNSNSNNKRKGWWLMDLAVTKLEVMSRPSHLVCI